MSALAFVPGVPEPLVDGDEAPLPDGEAVAFPIPLGPALTLRFPSPFEPYLELAGARVVDDDGGAARDALLWSARRLAALWRALDERTALRATVVGGALGAAGGAFGGGDGAHIVVTDLVVADRDDDAFEWADHGVMRERLDAANVELARFSVLGPLSTKGELEKRVRAIYAPGTLVEVRIEDGQRVIARKRVRVGR